MHVTRTDELAKTRTCELRSPMAGLDDEHDPRRFPWLAAPMTGQHTVTLVEGNSFCVCGPGGDMTPANAQGLYVADTRVVSRFELWVDGEPVESVQALPARRTRRRSWPAFRRRPVGPTAPCSSGGTRFVGAGMREDLTVVNVANQPARCTLTISVECDLADLFEVKAQRYRPVPDVVAHERHGELHVDSPSRCRGVRIRAEGARVEDGCLTFEVDVAAKTSWHATVEVAPTIDDVEVVPLFVATAPLDQAGPVRQMRAWQQPVPSVRTGEQSLTTALLRCREDLGALRLFDPDRPGAPPSVAAGAPWFMTLFGRDSLSTRWMRCRSTRRSRSARSQTLADRQGQGVDPRPRRSPGGSCTRSASAADAGVARAARPSTTARSTPRRCSSCSLGELRRWGIAAGRPRPRCCPHADRALDWIERLRRPGRRRLRRVRARHRRAAWSTRAGRTPSTGSPSPTARSPQPPIALCRGAGLRLRRATWRGPSSRASRRRRRDGRRRWPDQAAALKRGVQRPVLAARPRLLRARPRRRQAAGRRRWPPTWATACGPASSTTSKARRGRRARSRPRDVQRLGGAHPGLVDGRLQPDELPQRLGLAARQRHRAVGSDALRLRGRRRADRTGLLGGASSFGGRLPELFCGFDRAEFPEPVPYPTSCSPQAWAAATPVLLLRTLLRFDPSVPTGELHIAPALPREFGALRVRGVRVADARITLDVDGDRVTTAGLPPDLKVVP